MRTTLSLLVLGSIAVLSACFGEARSEVRFTFLNNTDTRLCQVPGLPDANAAELCDEVKPQGKTHSTYECGFPAVEEDTSPLRLVLTAGLGGDIVYNRSAPCNEWKRSGATITIDNREEKFVVTDSLSDVAPSP